MGCAIVWQEETLLHQRYDLVCYKFFIEIVFNYRTVDYLLKTLVLMVKKRDLRNHHQHCLYDRFQLLLLVFREIALGEDWNGNGQEKLGMVPKIEENTTINQIGRYGFVDFDEEGRNFGEDNESAQPNQFFD